MTCENCEYGPKNYTESDELVCLKLVVSFTSMEEMNRYAKENCNEPDANNRSES